MVFPFQGLLAAIAGNVDPVSGRLVFCAPLLRFAAIPTDLLHCLPKSFRLPVAPKMLEEYLLGLDDELVVNMDRIWWSVDRDCANPRIDRLPHIQDEQQSRHTEIKSSPFMPRLSERMAKAWLSGLRAREDGKDMDVLRDSPSPRSHRRIFSE